MTIQELRIQFIEALATIYETQEATNFFYWLTDAYLKMRRVDVAIQLQRKLNSNEIELFEKAKEQLLEEKPIQYIVGNTTFYGLDFDVNSSVLIPRQETEELVDWIVKDIRLKANPKVKILDIGTGSGCIAISLAKELPMAEVFAIDVSEEALIVARKNAVKNEASVTFISQNILESNKLDDYDIIVSNPPYVRNQEKEEMKPNVLENEPHLALFVANDDALVFYEKITNLAAKSLTKDGALYFEINQYLGNETKSMIEKDGFDVVELRKDLQDNDRMIKAYKKN